MPGGTLPGRMPGGRPGAMPEGIARTMPGGTLPGGGATGAGTTGIAPPAVGRRREELAPAPDPAAPGASPEPSGASGEGRDGGGGPSGCQITNGASSPLLPRPDSAAGAGVFDAFAPGVREGAGSTAAEDWAAAGAGTMAGTPARATRGSRATRLRWRRNPRGAGRPMAARRW